MIRDSRLGRPRPGHPGTDDLIAVWGKSPYARRGEAVAARTGAPLIRLEDAFLRSRPGCSARAQAAQMGLPSGAKAPWPLPQATQMQASSRAACCVASCCVACLCQNPPVISFIILFFL